jgi:hypothetical protein
MAVTIIVVAAIASPLVARLGLRMVLIAGLGMFAVGIVWFGQLPVHAGYLADVLGPSLLIALWLGLAFVPITILAETGLQDRETASPQAWSTPRRRLAARAASPS